MKRFITSSIFAAAICVGLQLVPPLAVAQETKGFNTETVVPAKFKISLESELSSKTVMIGDLVEAIALEDVIVNGQTLIPKQSSILGQITDYATGRNVVKSVVSKKERFRRNGELRMEFDTVITPKNHRFKINAAPIEQVSVFNNDGKFRKIQVSQDGTVVKAEGLGVIEPLLLVCVPVPHRMIERNRLEVKIHPGDEMTIQANIPCPDCHEVSGKVLPPAPTLMVAPKPQ